MYLHFFYSKKKLIFYPIFKSYLCVKMMFFLTQNNLDIFVVSMNFVDILKANIKKNVFITVIYSLN